VGYRVGIDVSASSVDQILLSAEPSPEALRREIERKWSAHSFDGYGLSDVGQPQAHECELHDGLHDISDWNLTEIVDPETKEPIQEPGREGILVFTNLVRKAMPAIRFWTNDITSWKSFEPCACKRTSARIVPISRRVDDILKVKGVNLWPTAVWTVLGGQSELTGMHRITVETRGGKDYLKIVAEVKEGIQIEKDRLVDSFKSKFQSTLFFKVDEIELVPSGSLQKSEHKEKVIIDMRKEAPPSPL